MHLEPYLALQHRVTRRSGCVRALVSVGVVALLVAGCSDDKQLSDPSRETAATDAPSTDESTDMSPTTTLPATTTTTEQSETPTTTAPPTTAPPTTAAPTLPPGPPAYVPGTTGDNLDLPSFVLTVSVDNTNNGQLSENVTTSGYVKDPVSVYELASFGFDGTTGGARRFLIGGRTYEENGGGDWYLFEAGDGGSPTERDFALSSTIVPGVVSADFDGPGEFAGIPANHFVFDETDLANYSSYSPENPSPAVEGDFYLAVDGNFVLYAHSKESSPNRTYEVTEAMAFVGQVPPIVLPPDLVAMSEALDIGVALGNTLLPPGSTLTTLIRYKSGIGIDYYRYRASVPTNEEFLAFYRTMQPTNGWSVTHIGHIKTHLEPVNCETQIECVILNNGGEQIAVSLRGGILLEYDHEHVFAPL